MLAHSLEQACRRSLLGRETREARDDLGGGLAILGDGARQAKDLRHPSPLVRQKLVEFSAEHDLADFQASMPFVHCARGAPIAAVGGRLAEKELSIVAQASLVALGDEHIVACPAVHAGAERVLGVQGIGAENAARDPQWSQELRDDGELILLLAGGLLFEQQACLGLIQPELMHGALVGLLMAQRAA